MFTNNLIYMKMKKNLFGSLLLVVLMFSVVSCSDDDDNVPDLENITTLNMLNVDNGATRLGTSDIYINNENNFTTSSCYLVEIGGVEGIGKVVPPKLGNGLVRKASVSGGWLYQAFDEETIMQFPSKTIAMIADAAYYQFYVDTYIMKPIPNTTTSVNVGAIVKYSMVYPDTQGLPGYGKTVINLLDHNGEAEISFPNDVEFSYEEDDRFLVETNGGLLKVTSGYQYTTYDYPIYVRRGNVFTNVIIRIK